MSGTSLAIRQRYRFVYLFRSGQIFIHRYGLNCIGSFLIRLIKRLELQDYIYLYSRESGARMGSVRIMA